MIDRVMVKKYAGQSALLWWGCAMALFFFAWVRVWVVSLMEMEKFKTVLEQFRDFEKFSPIPFDQMITYTGRVGMTFDEPIVMLCIVVWCVARGSDVVSGELGRGTLEMLLAQPISRTRLLLSHAFVSSIGLVGLVLCIWLGIWVGTHLTTVEESAPVPTFTIPLFNIELPLSAEPAEKLTFRMAEKVDSRIYASSVINLIALGFFLLGLSSMISSLDRYRWRTVGAVITIYVIQTVMYGLGKAAEQISFLEHMTFLTCYRPQQLMRAAVDPELGGPWRLMPQGSEEWLGPMAFPLILLVMGLVCYAIAVQIFRKR
ncbi:MAG: ABC transporter permease subunit, partial [Pirellulaceae bacterium]